MTDPSWRNVSFNTAENAKIAYQAAAEGAVLLSNKNKTLPLRTFASKKLTIGVLGELGVSMSAARGAMLGPYTNDDGTVEVPTVEQALRRSGGSSVNVISAEGASPNHPPDDANISSAISACTMADVLILVLGDSL